MLDLRIRNRLDKEQLATLPSKVLSPSDYTLLVTDSATISGPEGQRVAVFVKHAIPNELVADAYPILTTIRDVTDNRGFAAGSKTVRVGRQTRAFKVRSSIIGAFEADNSRHPMCRLTAWTGRNIPEWERLRPYIRAVSIAFNQYVPERFDTQWKFAQRTNPAWIIPETPFTTLTINNTYATGTHVDDGDLKEGYGCLTVIRRGNFRGGQLVLPEYRVAFEIGTGDILFYNAGADWHGNVAIRHPVTNEEITAPTPDFERISVVLYARAKMLACEDPAAEANKAKQKWGAVPVDA